jgi:hypothetical protein
MKKIVISTIIFVMASFSAFADKTNVGIKITMANMDADGSETTDSASINNGGAAVKQSKDADFEMGSLFIERQFEGALGGTDIALGLEVVPFKVEIDKLGGGTGFDATLEVGNLVTLYVQPMFNVGENTAIFVKAGFAQADLDISNSSRQAQAADQASDTAGTETASSKELEGPMLGAGFQTIMGDVGVRLEVTHTDFDEITHTNSNSKVLKADAELTQISLALVKTF